jgi:hypothetical protein
VAHWISGFSYTNGNISKVLMIICKVVAVMVFWLGGGKVMVLMSGRSLDLTRKGLLLSFCAFGPWD